MTTRIAVIYYSAAGNVRTLARAVVEGAAAEGTEVRLRHVAELPEDMLISFRQYWGRHRSELENQPDAALEDLEWADGIAFGTLTRFDNVAVQLKLFLDQWRRESLRLPRSRAATTSRGRTNRHCSSHGHRAHGVRLWRV
jgi:NAD(P)H dehydrogenase (quinone)